MRLQLIVTHFASALGAQGIPLIAVAPGVVETDLSNSIKTDARCEFALGLQALKRSAQPDIPLDALGCVLARLSKGRPWRPVASCIASRTVSWAASPIVKAGKMMRNEIVNAN